MGISDAIFHHLLFLCFIGVGMAYIAPSNLTIDVRCKYSITLTASAKGTATSEDIFIDSIVLFPDPAAVAQGLYLMEAWNCKCCFCCCCCCKNIPFCKLIYYS